ncbi:MAG TPA: type IV secretion system protein [Allosphingosinicella sp.]|jgi:type IV secretion system protein VirB6
MEACAALPENAGFIQSVLAFMDCQAHVLGASGYQALSAPGSSLTLVLSGFLTLFIALMGYRLMLGQGPDLRTGVLAFVKIGIVLALATSWPAYRTLVYDVVLSGPSQLAGEIGAPSGLPGAGSGLVARLDGADQAFVGLAVLGEGSPPMSVIERQAAGTPGAAPQPFLGFNTFAIGGARMLFLIGAIAGLGAVRLILGLLLAVGPFFVAFLLFDNTRSLFEGWVRVLAGAAFGSLAVAIALGAELALIEPWLSDLLARRNAGEWLPGMPVEILVVTFGFALIVAALIYASARVALAFRLAPIWNALGRADTRSRDQAPRAGAAARQDTSPAEARPRAAAVVDAVAATQRREAGIGAAGWQSRAARDGEAPLTPRTSAAGANAGSGHNLAPAPLGQSFRRRTRGRVSASAGQRDRRS